MPSGIYDGKNALWIEEVYGACLSHLFGQQERKRSRKLYAFRAVTLFVPTAVAINGWISLRASLGIDVCPTVPSWCVQSQVQAAIQMDRVTML